MAIGQDSINVYFRFIINSSKVKSYILSIPFLRDRDRTLIPEMLNEIRVFYAG